MRTHTKVIIGALVVLVAVVAAIVWSTRSSAPVPQFQNRVAIPGQDPHPVSLWLDPAPATVGENRLTVQVAAPEGGPVPAEEVAVYVFPEGEVPGEEIETTYTADAPIQDFLGTGHGFIANVAVPEPGIWSVEVHFTIYGESRTTTFEVEVSE